MVITIITTIIAPCWVCLSVGRICIYNLVNPWMIFIIITMSNIYFEDLFPSLHSKSFRVLSHLILSKCPWGSDSYCPHFTFYRRGIEAQPQPGEITFALIMAFLYGSLAVHLSFPRFFLLWILISGFTTHCCPVGRCKGKLHHLCFVSYVHHPSHALRVSGSVITLSIAYSKHAPTAEESRSERKRGVKGERERGKKKNKKWSKL